MTGFKNFILQEGAKAKHALRFMEYEQHEHNEIARKLRDDIAKAWGKIVAKIEPLEMTVDPEDKKQPLTDVSLVVGEESFGRYGTKYHVAPSVKIGGAYDRHVKADCKKDLLEAAKAVFDKYKDKMNKDVAGTPFFVSQEDGPLSDLRLKFKTGEYVKTVFMVGTEPGYKFERVYLRDSLQK